MEPSSQQQESNSDTIVINSTYIPNPTQIAAHSSPARYRGFMGSKGSGKSRWLIEESIAMGWENPGNRGIIARLDLEDLKETTMHFFFEYCPPPLILDRNRAEHWVVLASKDRLKPSRIKFAHCKDPKSFESGEIGFFALDETDEIPNETVKTLRSRMRLKGMHHSGLMAFNPPSKMHWLHDFFVKEVKMNPALAESRRLFRNNTYENESNLAPGYIDELKSIYTGDELNRFLMGEWGSTATEWSVYPTWRETFYVAPGSLKHEIGVPILRCWDFGMKAACLWGQVIDGRLRVLSEYMKFNAGAEQFIPTCKSLSLKYPGCKFIDISDPTFINNRSQVDARTIYQVAKAEGVVMKDGASVWKERTGAVEWFMGKIVNGKPGLEIDPSCTQLLSGFEGDYRYSEGSMRRLAEDVEDTDSTHIHDCLQHMAWYGRKKMSSNRIALPMTVEGYSFGGDSRD